MGVVEAFGDIATILAKMDPEKIANLQADEKMSLRVEQLVMNKKNGLITDDESIELERYLSLDLLLNLAKARANAMITQ